jgi:hypothetical protein
MSSLGGAARKPKNLWKISGHLKEISRPSPSFSPLQALYQEHIAGRDGEDRGCIAVANDRICSW